jgi:apolipoprotein N-acyltransferase
LWASAFLLERINWTEKAAPDFSVALVQGNIDQFIKWNPEHLEEIIKTYMDLSRPHWEADVMIWPETAIPAFYHHVPDIINQLQSKAQAENTEMLIGIPYRDTSTGEYYNSVIALGSGVSFYHKRHLVPFGEFIPFQAWISDVLDFMGLPMSGFSRGDVNQATLTTGEFQAGMTICYEIIFNSEVMQSLPEAHYLVNVSNNTWFGDSAMPFQQLQMARLRALESQRYVLSATNNGVSAVINHHGEVVAQSPQFQAHVLRASVEPRTGVTPFSRYKNIPILVLVVLLLVLARLLRPKFPS